MAMARVLQAPCKELDFTPRLLQVSVCNAYPISSRAADARAGFKVRSLRASNGRNAGRAPGSKVNNENLCKLLASVSLGVAMAAFGSRNTSVAFAATAEIVVAQSVPSASSPTQIQIAGFRDKAMYALDYFFATRSAGKAIVLLGVCAFLTGLGGLIYHYSGAAGTSCLPESIWTAWTFIADSGAHADQDTFRKRLIAVPITMGGMFFFALLVGLMTDAVSSKVDQLSKGKSRVLEENHTLIIGWTKKTIPLVTELAIANKTRGTKRSVVVMGSVDKEEMDSVLQEALPVPERFGTKIVTRTGSPASMETLNLCAASCARSIVLLSPPASSPMEADASVFQTCLLLASLPEIRADIIVELAELDHVNELGGLVRTLLPQKAEAKASDKTIRYQTIVPVATGDMAMRIMVKQVLEPGIVTIGRELLQFEGCEFHLKYWPELVGKTFGELLFLFEDAVPCGIRKCLPSGKSYTLLNPSLDTTLQEGDKLLVISEDENSYRPGTSNAPTKKVPSVSREYVQEKPAMKILIVGWKNDLNDVLHLIDSSVSKGSMLTLLSTADEASRAQEFDADLKLRHVDVEQRYGDPLSLNVLKQLPLEVYDKVILLRDESSKSTPAITAMLIRYIQVDNSHFFIASFHGVPQQVERGRKDSTIIAETKILEGGSALQNVQKSWIDDTVDPDYLEGMLLANLAEDVDIGSVLEEVIGSEGGSGLVLRHAHSYLQNQAEKELTFWDLQAQACQKGEILVAYKSAVASGGKWVVNPAAKSRAWKWLPGDELLVTLRMNSSSYSFLPSS